MERLFTYGTLQPGGPNEHVLAEIGGEWQPAIAKGRLIEAGWGAGMGYPGMVVDEAGTEIRGYVFVSSNLVNKWDFLDEFEGEGYERVMAPVRLLSGEQVQANVYVLRSSMPR